MFILTDCLSL